LINQHHEDILLISRQNELIVQLEKELSITPTALLQSQQAGTCECYQSDKYQLVIKNLELKIRHLEEEKKEFKEEIRNLVVKQEQLKHELRLVDEKCSDEVTHNRRLQDLLY
jgi:predicted RNase H-like nuclease (RuvC/YqgF family)